MLIRNTSIARCYSRDCYFKLVRLFSVTKVVQEGKVAPLAKVRWCYATDVPKSKPDWFSYTKEKEPEKFIPFSSYDSRRIEEAYKKLRENIGTGSASLDEQAIVEVNEDKLFQVDLKKLELSPVYWDGPIYEVRRGLWFTSAGIPLPDDISDKIEEGFLSKRPYNFEAKINEKKLNVAATEDISKFNNLVRASSSAPANNVPVSSDDESSDIIALENGKSVLYINETDALIFPSSINNRFQLGVIRKFASRPISLMSVEGIRRGYSKDLEESKKSASESMPKIPDLFGGGNSDSDQKKDSKEGKKGEVGLGSKAKASAEDEGSRVSLETEFENSSAAKANRKIDHLILCVHGIGQVLGRTYESVYFPHSINVLRNSMNSLYENETEFRKLKEENSSGTDNIEDNGIQALPILWRHMIDFHPHKSFEESNNDNDTRLPTLAQINVDGVKPLRKVFGDVVLDVLLYYEPTFLKQIHEVVVSELNRVYSLYKERNPEFNGKVHIMGHSLGSAIAYDILSKQSSLGDSTTKTNKLLFDVENLFCVGSPIGVFKLISKKNIVPRSMVPSDFDVNDDSLPYDSPKCQNIYNLFHPCDPVGYRMEPLINPKFAIMKPESVPFASQGINTQIKGLSDLGDEIQDKIIKASKWLSNSEMYTKSTSDKGNASEENPITDIILSVFSSGKKDEVNNSKKVALSKDDLGLLASANKDGRVDYSLPMGVFDFSLISAISAHISYFEDENTAGFLLRKVLGKKTLDRTDSKLVSLYPQKDGDSTNT